MALVGGKVATMQPIPLATSTVILGRLLCQREGEGFMVVSLPLMERMDSLAERLVDLEQGSYEELVVRTGERLVFPLREDARALVKDLRFLSLLALHRDAAGIGELLVRVGLSGWKVNPLRPEEMVHLEIGIGPGAWQKHTLMVGELS